MDQNRGITTQEHDYGDLFTHRTGDVGSIRVRKSFKEPFIALDSRSD